MDALLCNGVGIYLGMLTCRYLEIKVGVKIYLMDSECATLLKQLLHVSPSGTGIELR